MNRKSKILIISISTILFSILFHRQSLGLNVIIFELGILVWLYFSKQFKFTGKNQITCTLGLIITMLSTVFIYSTFAFIVNFLMLFLFIGVIIYPESQSLINAFKLSLSNLINSQGLFIKKITESKLRDHKIGSYLWRLRIFIIPVLIIILFLILYSNSNPIFNNLIQKTGLFFNKYMGFVFDKIDSMVIFTIIIGLIISIFILYRAVNQRIIGKDKASSEVLSRIKKQSNKRFKMSGLKNELKASIFLLFALNTILLVLNTIDVFWVWFNFEWNGLSLKEFVHEGTYLLILSIIISIIVVLYFFRNNLNFYKNNSLLKYLSFAWLAQNAILVISVAIRNYWYIYHYSLAYKRIGVIVFLLLTLYGLYTVFVKVKNKKSAFYLFNSNTYALVVVLVICSVINWDSLIAKYNFRNHHRSFIHFDYLSSLSDKSLPYLVKTMSELTQIDKIQKGKFPSEQRYYMSPEKYYQTIEEKRKAFKLKWKSKSFLSWNLPEYLAYKKLYCTKRINPKTKGL